MSALSVRSVISIAVILLTSATGRAEEMIYTQFQGYSAISGIAGDNTAVLPRNVSLSNSNTLLQRLEFGEKGDEPCVVKALTRNSQEVEWNDCGSSGSPFKKLHPPNWSGNDGQHALKRIRICNNSRNNERAQLVKGVESRWVIYPYFKEGVAEYRDKFSRNNCTTWRNWVSCPAHTAAGALRLHHKRIGGKDSLVGIQLACYQMAAVKPINEAAVWRRNTNYWTSGSGDTVSNGLETFAFSLSDKPDGDRYYLMAVEATDFRDKGREFRFVGRHSSVERLSFSKTIDLRTYSEPRDHNWPDFYQQSSGSSSISNASFARSIGVCIKDNVIIATRINQITIDDRNQEVFSDMSFLGSSSECQWQTNASCTSDEVVTGFVIYYRDKRIRGLKVQCAKKIEPLLLNVKRGTVVPGTLRPGTLRRFKSQ